MSTFQGFGRCNNSTALARYVPCCAVTDIKISCHVPDQLADQTATGGKRRNRIIKYRSQLFRPHLLQERLKNCSMCVCVRAGYFFQLWWINPLTPNDDYSGRTAPLTSKRCILYIYSTNIGTEYFKQGIYSPFFSLQNAVCFIILTYLVPVLFTFYIQGVLKLKKIYFRRQKVKHHVKSVRTIVSGGEGGWGGGAARRDEMLNSDMRDYFAETRIVGYTTEWEFRLSQVLDLAVI